MSRYKYEVKVSEDSGWQAKEFSKESATLIKKCETFLAKTARPVKGYWSKGRVMQMTDSGWDRIYPPKKEN